ncbi:hypothetical protein [Arthrobacter sp. ISL-48]|nr:hypothetical protein [Arthrobacter sp. ISL-48]
MRFSICRALANYCTHLKSTREHAKAVGDYRFTNQAAPAGTK